MEDAFFSIARDCVSKIKAEGAGEPRPGAQARGRHRATEGDKTSACCGS